MIPKSLHTVTAIVAVSRHLNADPVECLQLARRAAEILGYPAGATDTYQLIERAAAILSKGQK